MAEPEYPVLREIETRLKLQWIDTDDVMATQRAIIQVEPESAYLELPRGRKGDKGDPGPAISIQGIVAADSQLPANAKIGHAYVNASTKGLAVWNGAQWFKVSNFAGVDADVRQFSRWFAQIESDTRRAVDAAERAEFAAEETIQQVTGDFATRNYVDSHPGMPSLDNSPGISWAVTDGEFAALATTTAGAVDIRRATPGAAKAVLDASGSDPRVPTVGDAAGLAWAVTDADHAALAVTTGGEVDFGGLTDRAKSTIGTTAWVVATDGGEAHATYLPTGQRIHVSDAESWIEASGLALTYDAGGKTVWRKTPTDGPWEAASVDRFAWWGSSTVRGFNAGLFDLLSSKGIPSSNYFDGGIGSDRAAHILGRMGAEPFKLAAPVTFPASQFTNSVYFEIEGVPPTAGRSDTWGSWGNIYGRLSMIDSQWRFTPQALSSAKTLPAGTEFIPDAATQFRDAVTIVNIAKNDFVGEGKDARFIFNETKKATDWLRSLARHHLVLGHFSNNNWAAGDPRIAGIDEANRLCAKYYGARYIDLNAYILGEQVWTDAGITPTADDLAAQARRVLPPSLSANANHFSNEFNLVLVDKLIRPALETKGWL